MSKYDIELNRILSDLENLFCLDKVVAIGQSYKGIDDVLEFSLQEAENLPSAAIKDLNVSVSKKMVLLSYMSSRMRFFNKKEVDFSNMPCLYNVAQVLLKFTLKKTVNPDTFSEVDKCIIILEDMEKIENNTNTSSYRLLRVFVLCTLYGLLCNAGIIADFILMQMIEKGV